MQLPFFVIAVIVLMLASCPGVARENIPQPRSKPAAAPSAGKPSSAAESKPQRIPQVPMEVFAAEPDPDEARREADGKTEERSACYARIADQIAVIEALPALGGPGDCGAVDVVRLEAVIQPDKSRVLVSPPATLRCTMAEAVANWVREDLTPATAPLGAPLRAVDNYASYDCRGRNRVAGAIISQHGLANAIDVRGVNLGSGKLVEFTDRKLAREFRETLRKQACARFTTVLGPGADGHHESHIHLDLAERRGGYRLCQWNVLDPHDEVPLPRPRPAEAPGKAS